MSTSLGPLEERVMGTLWRSCERKDLPLAVREITDQLPESAYTTVATVLGNLTRKEMVEQFREGRRLLYRPRLTRAEYAAELMVDALDASRRPHLTFATFVAALSPEQHELLLEALGQARSRIA